MKIKIFFLLTIGCIISTQTVFADPITIPVTAPQIVTTPVAPLPTQTILSMPPLVQKIQDAKATLSTIPLNYTLTPVYKHTKKNTAKPAVSSYSLGARDLDLAILDPATNQTSIVIGSQNAKSVTFNNPNFSIKETFFNGVNSSFAISKPTNGIVLALKYLITGPESGTKTSIVNGMQQVMYTPYSNALNTPDVAAYGNQYIDQVINQVTIQLQNIPSLSNPGDTIPQSIKPSIVKALVFAEHTNTSEYSASANPQSIASELDTLYAGNEGDTFKYSVSTAGARGIAQFIPSTYLAIAKRHPEANLNPNYIDGLDDHVNAIKAEVLLLDDDAAAVHAEDPTDYNPAYIYDYAAASYNGGSSRVVHALEAYGQNWNTDHSAELNNLQSQINSAQSTVSSLRSQLKKAKTTASKNTINLNLISAKNTASSLEAIYNTKDNGTLRSETISYLYKMHTMIQIFNA